MTTSSSRPRESYHGQNKRTFTSMGRWYWPYLRPFWARLFLTSLALAVVLACQALIPLTVENLLHHAVWDLAAMSTLLALIVVQLCIGHLAHMSSHLLAIKSSGLLQVRVFSRLLDDQSRRLDGVHRASLVSRHTTDVDNVGDAFEKTLVDGIPGILRIIISLSLLTMLEWPAGIVMTVAALAFVAMRMRMAKSLAAADLAYFDARGYVGESVDEALTSPHTISGMRLRPWIESRFTDRSRQLGEASHHQGIHITWLLTGAHAAGLAGLVAVVLFGLAVGGDGLASVAASLLYVEGVVKGLEALPPWVRQVHFGMVSSLRIDQILVQDAAGDSQSAAGSPGLTRGVTNLPDNCLVGIVTPPGIDADAALAQIADGSHATSGWTLSIDGIPVNENGIHTETIHVPQEPLAFNASILEHFQATAPDLDEVAVRQLLDRVNLGYLISNPDDLSRPLGPTGNRLTINERQRLAIAMALAKQPRLLAIGPVLAFADTDTALPTIKALRASRLPAVIVTVRTAEVASAMDLIIFATGTEVQADTHENLLMSNADYSQLWSARLTSIDVDLSVLGIDDESKGALLTRLVTERYPAGDILYREGAPADRIIFTVSGRIEIMASASDGTARRVAVIGPGNHCGDLRLTTGEVRAETAIAIDETVVRSLSREAISAGMAGLLDRTPTERRVISAILRAGPSTIDELGNLLDDLDDAAINGALALLTRDGALVEESGRFRAVHKRATKTGAADILDRLADL